MAVSLRCRRFVADRRSTRQALGVAHVVAGIALTGLMTLTSSPASRSPA